ncbi:MAG: tannase/feruloyl esterase family alpha/beta hydrolase [Novosphingobium sp.]|nr:tannase/feruloyl esterase family alpha/beta hydrolase [Novosphingobium sp.]
MKVHCRILPAASGLALLLGVSAPALAEQVPVSGCDDSLRAAFQPEDQTTITLIKLFRAGEKVTLGDGKAGGGSMVILAGPPATAQVDLCLVKLSVGPGNPGPEGAPSTSAGIGMEVWLPSPAVWNGRIHNMGGGGWVGGDGANPEVINWTYAIDKANVEHSVTSMQDTGHTGNGGAFAMLPDGTPNRRLWEDFAVRGLHQQTLKTKALARAFYGRDASFAYFEGGSTGGRQAHKLAQAYPDDYDGIIGMYPAINWSRFVTGMMHKYLVYERDLDGKGLTAAQEDLVSLAAIRACDTVGGVHLGYVIDQAACRYDPAKDAQVLCASDGGNNKSSDCVTLREAAALNRIWYGPTINGSVPDPAIDNGYRATLAEKQVWFGVPRGTLLTGSWYVRNLVKANPQIAAGFAKFSPNSLQADWLALALQNPAVANPDFVNATGNGEGLWRELTPRLLANVADRGKALQAIFSYIDTDNPDLSRFKARGGKFLGWHGINDELIPVQGTMNYYTRLAERMGGVAQVNSFYRMFIVPGAGHGTPVGAANGGANPPAFATQMFDALTAWVERGKAPERLTITSARPGPDAATMPTCPLPTRIVYRRGDPLKAASYTCE